ncbi:MAG TPA: hypothetical protein VFZ08_02075 [Terriglobia bacterium]|nr:hypothetical protein [Terriglobia bacterium]
MFHIARPDAQTGFEDIEEKLKQLEEMPLSPGSPEEADNEDRCDFDPGKPDPAGTRFRAAAGGIEPSLKSSYRAAEAEALQDCRARTRYLIQGAVEEARYRLKALAGAMIPVLQSEIEKTLDGAAEAAFSRAAVAFERRIHEIVARSADEALERVKAGMLEAAATVERANGTEEKRLDALEAAQALAPTVEELRDKLASFLEEARQQLQNVLRAFEESAARHPMGRSPKTGLPESEIAQAHSTGNGEEAPINELPSVATQKSPEDGTEARATPVTPVPVPLSEKPVQSVAPAAGPNRPEKPRQKQASWRILGL